MAPSHVGAYGFAILRPMDLHWADVPLLPRGAWIATNKVLPNDFRLVTAHLRCFGLILRRLAHLHPDLRAHPIPVGTFTQAAALSEE